MTAAHSIWATLFIALFSLFATAPCQAVQLQPIQSLFELHKIQEKKAFTAPFSLLANTHFTTELGVYTYKENNINILDDAKIHNIVFNKTTHIIKSANTHSITKQPTLPWWSKDAPIIIKKLNFLKVDGKSNHYDLGQGYKLTLLAKQGAWGKVYILEHVTKSSGLRKICAVKLIFSRSDRSMTTKEFHQRHQKEVKNNLIITDWDIAVKPYGIIKHDADHYLLFMEYGEGAHQYIKNNSRSKTLQCLYTLMNDVEKMHQSGYAHGDLKLDNMLYINNKFKLCDWFSLKEIQKTVVGTYRYDGDNLPPEALRALYFKDDKDLKYSLVTDGADLRSYFLHPIAADRFCLAVDLMETIAPDLYKNFYCVFPKNFNFWAPTSLDFWPEYVKNTRKIQRELLSRSKKIEDPKERELFKDIARFLDVNPFKRTL